MVSETSPGALETSSVMLQERLELMSGFFLY